MRRKCIYLLLSLCLYMSSSSNLVVATEIQKEDASSKAAIVSTSTVDDELFLFVKSPKETMDQMTYQIGTSLCKNTKSESINQLDVAMKTLILIDNSYSISQANRSKIKAMLLELIAEKKDNEYVRIATFNNEVQYLTDYISDYTELKKTIQCIEYKDQETYLTDVLYNVLEKDFTGAEKDYNRIIVISDGVDNKALGYTKEELYAKLDEKSMPVYTFGCSDGKNNEQLKNMFALSRASHGNYYLMDEIKDVSIPVQEMAADRNIIRLKVIPNEELLDGSVKNSKLTFEQDGKQYILTTDVLMPFKVKAEVKTTEPSPDNTERETAEDTVPEKEDKTITYLICGIAAVVGIGTISAVIIMIIKKKKRQNSFETITSREVVEAEEDFEEPTEIAHDDEEEMTCRIWNEPTRRTLVLTDMNAPSKTFQVPLIDSVIIGRSSKKCSLVIDYDKSVSAQHCEIEVRPDNKVFIVDLQSSNGTYINDNRVLTETEVSSGVIIKLGRLEFKLEIR